MRITDDVYQSARRALAETTDRFVTLVASNDPGAMATKDWTVADTLAHVGRIASAYADLVHAAEQPVPEVRAPGPVVTVDMVHAMNKELLAQYPERDPAVLLERLRHDVDEILRAGADLDPSTPLPWLGDARVPRAGLLAHLVNELQIHGRDIARGTGSPWVVPPADAALFFDVFFVGMLRNHVGTLLDNDEPPRERRIAVGFHSHYTTPVTLVLHRGEVSAAEPGGPADVHLFFDPPTLNLVLFHRIGKPRAMLSGKLLIWGRRPWLLRTFFRTVRFP